MKLSPKVDAVSVSIDENKIVTVRPTPGHDVNLTDIKTTFFWAVEQIKPNKMNVLVVGSQGISFDRESRDFLKSSEFQENINNYALVVANFGQSLIVDFLFKLKKPQFEYKVFTSEKNAIKWLFTKI